MQNILDRTVERFLREHDVHEQALVVGVSGGADSLALLCSLRKYSDTFALRLHAAHLNHQLRGAASEEDARFVEELARAWRIPATVESHDVLAFARAKKLSTEEAARLVRYGFLEQVAQREGARAVAVAHHADDQVETIVMHFIRGAGLAGLRGMLESVHHPFRPPLRLLRPLLGVTRAEIEEYCASHQITARNDESNADLTLLRNRLRHELLPILESYNPNIREGLRRNARVLRDDYDYLTQRARGAFERVLLERTGGTIAFALSGWRALQPSLQRALIRLAVSELRPAIRHLDSQHVEAAFRVANRGRVGARATLPEGLWLFRDFDAIVIAERLGLRALPLAPAGAVQLNIPGRTRMNGPWSLEAEMLMRDQLPTDAMHGIDPLEAFLDAERCGAQLEVRARRANDRFKPLGLAGHAKPLRRFMIDAKIPASWRAKTPLVTAGDEVIWVAGWRIADPVKLTEQTRRVLRLKFVRDSATGG